MPCCHKPNAPAADTLIAPTTRRQCLCSRQALTSALLAAWKASGALLQLCRCRQSCSTANLVLNHPALWPPLMKTGALVARCAWTHALWMPLWVPANACTPWWQSTARAVNCAFLSVRSTVSNWCLQLMAMQQAGLPGRQPRQTVHALAMCSTRRDSDCLQNTFQRPRTLFLVSFQAVRMSKRKQFDWLWPKHAMQLPLIGRQALVFALINNL